MQNFQISIVSAVKICKQCLQNFRPPGPLGYSPPMQIPVAANDWPQHGDALWLGR